MKMNDKIEISALKDEHLKTISICATDIAEHILSLQHTLSILGVSHVHTDDAVDRIYSNSLEIGDICNNLLGRRE